MKKKVCVLGGFQYQSIFFENDWSLCDVDGKPDLICFTGGTDVDPELYGESRLPCTDEPDRTRDAYEARVFRTAKCPTVGICRGSQFLTVMNGGALIQDVDNHAIPGVHRMEIPEPFNGKSVIDVTSTHHQMMYPFDVEHLILGKSERARSWFYKTHELVPDMICEPEVVYYPDSRSLAVQYHPEYMPMESDGYQYFLSLLSKLLSESF